MKFYLLNGLRELDEAGISFQHRDVLSIKEELESRGKARKFSRIDSSNSVFSSQIGICEIASAGTSSPKPDGISIVSELKASRTYQKRHGASIMLAKLAMEAGLPNGVLNILHGTNVIIHISLICFHYDL
ncbi:hypothetical protein L1887_01015 [Cichorium endivia]|nr:hypothetical protein L1887_01015 [Cichorium endivia]